MSNFRITKLVERNILFPNDLLMISRQSSESVYSSYKIGVNILISKFNANFEKLQNVTVTGQWKFIENSKFLVDSKNIVNDDSVINKDYAITTFLKKMNSLSSEIYDTPHIPSAVGEIIYSTTLNNLERVRKKYGSNTSWEQIPGRFIMNSTTNKEIGKTLGEANVVLKIKNTPEHTHTLTADSTSKKIKINEFITPKASTIVKADSRIAEPKLGSGYRDGYPVYVAGRGNGTTGRKIVLDFAVEGNMVEDGERTNKCRTNVAGSSIQAVSIAKNTGNNIGHNNIPPFYSVYVWKRIK